MIPALLSPVAPGYPAQGRWLQPLQNWPAAAVRSVQTAGAVVRILVASVRGSAPRESGTSMLVDPNGIAGTIGGGQLEWSAIAVARHMLTDSNAPAAQLQKLILGPQLAQCCGGAVQVWLERYTVADLPILRCAEEAATRTHAILATRLSDSKVERRVLRHPALDEAAKNMIHTGEQVELVSNHGNTSLRERLDRPRPAIWLYGAGHVGQAVARVLATLPVQLTWIDSRPELLPTALESSVQIKLANDPVATLADAPPGALFVVMTHSHALDYQLCKTILESGHPAWLGLIGSNSKSARFRSRLLEDGVPEDRVRSLVCPIGLGDIDSKLPSVIAVSVAAQLMQRLSSAVTNSEPQYCSSGGCQRCALDSGTTS